MASEPTPFPTIPAVLPLRFRPFVEWVTRGGEAAFQFQESPSGSDLPVASRRVLRALLLDGERDGCLEFASPAGHPLSVQPIAGQLFAAYRVDGGHVLLAGCQLEEHLVCVAEWNDGAVSHHTAAGDAVPAPMSQSLGLHQLDRETGLGDISSSEAARAIASLCSQSAEAAGAPRHITLVQCRYASGKVRFTIGNATWELPFAGWTGSFTPPPFVCPHTGVATFHLAATDDGRIAAADEIVACHRTGRRLLRQELARCAVSGAYVLPQYAVTCPVTGETVEQSALVECATCRQLVSPHALEVGTCAACRALAPVDASEKRLATILTAHPGLNRWRHWKLAETADVFIAQGQGVWQRLLAVFDRQSLHCRHLATRNRLSNHWTPLDNAAIRETLGS